MSLSYTGKFHEDFSLQNSLAKKDLKSSKTTDPYEPSQEGVVKKNLHTISLLSHNK